MARWNPSWHLCLSGSKNGVNPTELLGELAELYPQMNTDDLQERLARILFVANIWGRLHERDNG